MADVITRFKLETTQYDSKLRDASKSLADYAKEASKAGGEFDRFTKSNVDAARAFGTISTSASNAKDKVKELVGAYNTAANAYNALTKEQQQSDFGKALAASMTQLKGRISEAKQEMNSTGGIMDQLAQKFTISFDAVKMFNVGLKAAQGALKVAKDAFFQSESNIDEWGRTVEGAKGAYNVFLNTLNSGNWSNFFQNLQTAIKGGRDLYDAFDKLGSIKANNQLAIATVQAQIQQLRVLKQQGQDVDKQIKEASQRLRDLQMQGVNAGSRAGIRQAAQTIVNRANAVGGNGVLSQSDLINALRQLRSRGNDYVEEQRALAGRLSDKASEHVVRYNATTRRVEDQRVENLKNLTKEELRQYALAKAVSEGETEIQKGLDVWASAVREEAGVFSQQFRAGRYAGLGTGGGRGGHSGGTTVKSEAIIPTGSMADLNNQIRELRSAQDKATNVDDWKKYEQQIWAVTNRVKELKGQLSNIESGNMSSLSLTPASISRPVGGATSMDDVLNKGDKAIANFKPPQTVDDLVKKGRETQQAWNMAAGAVQNVGAAFSQIEDPSVKAIGTVTQAIASIALGFAMASSQANTAGTGWGWLAWVAAGAAAMATTISTIHSLTNLAGGGIVPGNSFSGDNIYGGGAMVNSGELVLNTAQQVNLANALQGSNGGLSIETVVRGEDLRIMLRRNSNRRSGGFETLR